MRFPFFSFDGREGIIATLSPDGEIGRHKRLKISRLYGRTGSIPVPGTSEETLPPSGAVHSVEVTPTNEADITLLPKLLRHEDQVFFADAGLHQ